MTSPVPNLNSSRDFAQWKRLARFSKPYRGRFALGIVLGMISGLGGPALAKSLSHVWDQVFEQSGPRSWAMLGVVLLLPLIMIVRSLTSYLSTYCMSWVGTRMITDLRQAVFDHLQRLSLDFYTQSNVGDLISRVTNDCQQAQSAVTSVIADSIKHPFTLIATASFLVFQDLQFSLAAVLLAPLCIIPIVFYGRRIRKISQLAQQNQGDILSRLHESITGVRVVKAFGMEAEESKKFLETGLRQFSYQMRIVRSTNILSPLIEVVAAFGAAAALFYAYQSGLHASEFLEMLVLIFFLYDPIKNLSKLHSNVQKGLAATDRVFSILDLKPSVVEKPKPLQLPRVRHHLKFEKVWFAYDSNPVLKDINLTITHGMNIALVGPSGAGKSSLLNLLLRFYDPTQGAILLDDVNIRDVSLLSLRAQIALVTQDIILFNDTIKNNIRYGSLQASDADIQEAARRAHAHEFILAQSDGYSTLVGDKGVKLSGGQKQRLALARAILKNPSILLLDEATSALDAESEKLIQATLDEFSKGRIVIAIAHRLSTILQADRIVVLEAGRIIDQGTHEQLLQRPGLYRKLYQLQFEDTAAVS